jgi:hypothetical protein
MICGASGAGGGYERPNFPYRSRSELTRFFRRCELDYVRDGSTRQAWFEDVLEELNNGPSSVPDLPSDGVIRVVRGLIDPFYYVREALDREQAMADLTAQR